MDILIKNATIVTQNAKREVVHGDITVKDGRIAAIGKMVNEKAEKTIDATSCIAMPGLVNMHTHVAMTLFRGLDEDLPLERWLQEKIWPLEEKEIPEDAYYAARLAMLEMVKSGTTAFADMCLLGVSEIARAAREIGIRAHISQALSDKLPGKTPDSELEVMKLNAYKPGELVQYGVGPHSQYACSEELLTKIGKFAKKQNLIVHIHASETRKEVMEMLENKKMSTYEYLDKLRLITERTILVHGNWVSKKEIAIAGKHKAVIAHTPSSELKLATGGICPIIEYDKAGAVVCLGTDSVASNNSLNMFGEMKLAAILQKYKYWKADALPMQRIMDFATLNGAKALGIASGSLEIGKAADIVILKKEANMVPENDIIANVVYAADPSNVRDVIVNGKLIMENRTILTVDVQGGIEDAETQAKEMIGR
jgi:5-methylthioadenosine/S-adenosylhomocysteine deaminase